MNGQGTESYSRHVTGLLIGVLLVLMTLTMAAFWYTEQQRDLSLQYSGDSNALRILSAQLAKDSIAAAAGDEDAFTRLDKGYAQLQANYDALMSWEEKTPLLAEQHSKDIRAELVALQEIWSTIQPDIQWVIDKKSSLLALNSFTKPLREIIPLVQSQYDLVIQNLIDFGASARQVQQAQEQVLRAERILSNLNLIFSGNENFESAAADFARDTALFSRVLDGMIVGDEAINLAKVNDESIVLLLRNIQEQFTTITDAVDGIVISAPDLYQLQRITADIVRQSETLFAISTLLLKRFQELPSGSGLLIVDNNTVVKASGFLTLFLLLLTSVQIFHEQRRLQQVITKQRSDNESAVTALMQELNHLAEGDLTIKITVRDDITGPIADAVNYTIEQLRMQFTVISQTSQSAQTAAEDNLLTMRKLNIASEYQRREIIDVAMAMKQLTQSLDTVAQTAQATPPSMQQGITIHDSAVIQDIVQRLEDVRERANILAINVAIKVSGGETLDPQFAGIVDEANQLTQHLSQISQALATFVNDLPGHVPEHTSIMTALELSAKLEQQAEIVQMAKNNWQTASDITAALNVVRELATQTAQGANVSTTLTANLAELATDMRASVHAFKLPEVKHIALDRQDSVVEEKHNEVKEADREVAVPT